MRTQCVYRFLILALLSLITNLSHAEDSAWTEFSLQTFQAVAKKPVNVVYSPYSLASGLRLLLPATEGENHEKLLGFLKGEDSNPLKFVAAQFLHSDAIWLDHSIHAKDPFRYAIRDQHGYMAALDFGNAADSAKVMNEWADGATLGLIKKFITPAELKGVLVLLADAVAIQAKWLTNGDLKESAQVFHGLRKSSRVSFLTAGADARAYLKADKMQMLEIAMAEGEVVFGMIMPDPGVKFAAWQAALTPAQVRAWNNQAVGEPQKLRVHFPALHLTSELQLKPVLEQFGLTGLFAAGSQLPGITDSPPLNLGWVKQNVFLQADKTGVKAAAVTSTAVRGMAMPVEKILDVTIDRPYIFYLTDQTHRHLLFLGQRVEP